MPFRTRWYRDAPLVIAHRGASLFAPENTLEAFALAIDQGAHAIEVDAKLTRDGVVILHHDRTLERTTNGTGAIHRSTLEELKQLNAAVNFKDWEEEVRIPTLDEVFARFGNDILWNVELTNYATPWDALPQEVIKVIQRWKLEESTLISSFNPIALQKTKSRAEHIPRALLISGSMDGTINRFLRKVLDHQFIHPSWEDLSSQQLEKLLRQNRRINVWTVNSLSTVSTLLRFGVHGIITDDPPMALSVI